MLSFLLSSGVAVESVSSDVTAKLASVNWTNPTWDLFIALFFVVAAFLYGLSLEKDKIIIILISVYMALGVLNVAPFVGKMYEAGAAAKDFPVPADQFFVFKIIVFLVIFLCIFFLLSYSVNLKAIARAGLDKWWEVVIFSFLHVGLLISIVLSFLPDSVTSSLTIFTRAIFVDKLSQFFWIVAPIAAMVLVRSSKKAKMP